MNLYEILGVERDATFEDIKRAFRKKAKKAHPDVGGDADTFKAIEEAYRVLSDASERAYYDAHNEIRKDTPDLRRQEMMTMLLQISGHVMASIENPETTDFVECMRIEIRGGRKILTEKIADAKELQARMLRIKKRIKSKREDNVLAHIVQQQIEALGHDIMRGDTMTQAYQDGLDLLDGYGYEVTRLLMSADLSRAYEYANGGGSFYTLK